MWAGKNVEITWACQVMFKAKAMNICNPQIYNNVVLETKTLYYNIYLKRIYIFLNKCIKFVRGIGICILMWYVEIGRSTYSSLANMISLY